MDNIIRNKPARAMSLIDVDFEWWRDEAGYRLLGPEAVNPPSIAHSDCGFEVKPTLLELVGKPQRVVPNSGRRIACHPLRTKELFKTFAHISTAEQVLHFINHHGPLTDRGFRADLGEEVALVLEHAAAVLGWLNGSRRPKKLREWLRNQDVPIANLHARLGIDASGMFSLRITPKNLLGGLWLQLAAMAIGGERAIRACNFCGDLFEAGRGTRRRLDAKFCSDEHRIRYNSLKRSEGG
jgi:hypothetical protein